MAIARQRIIPNDIAIETAPATIIKKVAKNSSSQPMLIAVMFLLIILLYHLIPSALHSQNYVYDC